MVYCEICYEIDTDPILVCDTCECNYCEDCSYTFSIHYQFQGGRCYICADQRRRRSLTIEEKRDKKIKFLTWKKNG